jgi:rhamnosyltransferase
MPADPESPRVAAVVLAYHPGTEVLENVRQLLLQVPRVFVVNNSPHDDSRAVLTQIADERVTVLDQTGNVGVAAGFNAGMRAGLAEGFDSVWIFDQDSTVTDGMLAALLRAQARTDLRPGIVGPALRAAETGNVYDADRGQGSAPIDALISSGALFSRNLLEEIGLHDEGLFIDYVDHDISLRAGRAGRTNLKVYDTLLDHRFGDSQPATFFGRRIYLSNYSPMRQYYMSRNRVIVARRFGMGRWFRDDVRYGVKAWVKVIFCEKERPAKIAAFFRGLRDGLIYRDTPRTGI